MKTKGMTVLVCVVLLALVSCKRHGPTATEETLTANLRLLFQYGREG